MARGLGGDDGPSLWMFIACILIWGKIQGWFNSASDKLGQNWANPIQPETTAQIQAMTNEVKNTTYKSSNLKQKLAYYQKIADEQYKELTSSFNIDEDRLKSMLKPLNTDELKCVYKCFGVKDATVLAVVAGWTQDLFGWYEHLLTDSSLGGQDLTEMRAIWKKTGLWANL